MFERGIVANREGMEMPSTPQTIIREPGKCSRCGGFMTRARLTKLCDKCLQPKSRNKWPTETTDTVPQGRLLTSREAFASTPRQKHQRRILKFIDDAGTAGAICDEAEAALELPHQTCSARFNDLKRGGLIYATGEHRQTRRDRKAEIYRLTDRGEDLVRVEGN